MRELPILFTGPMVRATMDGSMTQTRRVMSPQPIGVGPIHGEPVWRGRQHRCPYGAPGDLLYVRETYAFAVFRSAHRGLPLRVHPNPWNWVIEYERAEDPR